MARLLRMLPSFAVILAIAPILVPAALSQQKVAIQRVKAQNGLSPSGGYKPPALSLTQLLESNHAMNKAMMMFAGTGDTSTFKSVVFHAAEAGDIGAELLLAEQYIPEQCTFEPNQDVPHCGKDGKEPPHVVFRQNPLGIEASYEEAGRWLEKASAQGSGEATEVLAQLITRMRHNGHETHYTAADSARLHALARSQGFDVEPISVTCYKLIPGGDSITLGQLSGLVLGEPPQEPFTQQELAALSKAGISGSLLYGGGGGSGESVLLTRPEGPVVNVRIILDHDPKDDVLLPMPAHHDEIYVQRGDDFLAFPGGESNLPRFINIEPQTESPTQISFSTEMMSGAHSGGFCTRFP